ncbi:MAG: hypothetical protein ABIR06_12695 [Cyclobacteriaceae bacterium]
MLLSSSAMKGKKAEESSGYKRITIERLREFPGLEKLSDQEAKQVIDSLERLSLILFSYLQKSRN